MQLNFEKVYETCCLQTKKRYVGRAFESLQDWKQGREETQMSRHKGFLDSKGIETMRRDQCGLVRKTTTTFIQTIFSNSDLSKLKDVFSATISAIYNFASSKSLPDPFTTTADIFPRTNYTAQDFIFSKDVRLGSYSWNKGGKPHTLPPQAVVALFMNHVHQLEKEEDGSSSYDEDGVVDYRQQIAYVVTSQGAGRIIDRAVPTYRIFQHPPKSISVYGGDEIQRNLQSLWYKAIGQYGMGVDFDYYIKKQVVRVLQRLVVLIPDSSSETTGSLQPENWPYDRVIPSLLGYNALMNASGGANTKFTSLMRGLEENGKREENCSPQHFTPTRRRLPISPAKAAKTMEQFFNQSKRRSKIPNYESTKYRKVCVSRKVCVLGLNSTTRGLRENGDDQTDVLTILDEVGTQKAVEEAFLISRKVCFNCVVSGTLLEIENCREAIHCPVYFRRISVTKAWYSLKRKCAPDL